MEWVGWGWVGLFLATGTARRRRQTDAAATGVAFRGRFSTSPVAVFSSFAICLFVFFFVVAVVVVFFSLVLLLPSKSIRASLSLCRRSVPLICCCHFFFIIIIIIIFWGFALHAGSRVVGYRLCSDWIFSAFRCARSVTRGIRYLSLSLSLSFSFFFNIFNWPPFYRRWWLVSDAADDRRTAAASPMQRKERNENETRPDETGFFFRLISFVFFLCVCVCVCNFSLARTLDYLAVMVRPTTTPRPVPFVLEKKTASGIPKKTVGVH